MASDTDEYMFLTALVPLQLIDNNKKIIWLNPKPSSTFYCRPIKFAFIKENAEVVRKEEKKITDSVKQLKVYSAMVEKKTFQISYEMILTMFDGSVANILSETNSASKCIICGATPREMNLKTVLNKSPIVDNYRFGLSTLHCWIRFFECLIHIAYRLPIKTWRVQGDQNKKIVENTKKIYKIILRAKWA